MAKAKRGRKIEIDDMEENASKASQPEVVNNEKLTSFNGMTVVYRDSRKLKAHPLQQEYFGGIEDDLSDIFPTILASGVRQPLEIRVLPNGEEQINAGHRRQAASIKAGSINPERYDVPCIIYTDMTDEQAEEDFISTNFFRPIPKMVKARMIQREKEIISEKIKRGDLQGKTSDYLAQQMGTSESTVKRLNKYMKLIPELQELATKEIITQDQVMKLYNKSEEEQREFAEIFSFAVGKMTTEEVKKATEELTNEKSELSEKLRKTNEEIQQERETIQSQVQKLRDEKEKLEEKVQNSDSAALEDDLLIANKALEEKELELKNLQENGATEQLESLRESMQKEKESELAEEQKKTQTAIDEAKRFEELYNDAKDFDMTKTPEYQQLQKRADKSQELQKMQDTIEVRKDAESVTTMLSTLLDQTFPQFDMIIQTAVSLELQDVIDPQINRLLELVDKYRETIKSATDKEDNKTA